MQIIILCSIRGANKPEKKQLLNKKYTPPRHVVFFYIYKCIFIRYSISISEFLTNKRFAHWQWNILTPYKNNNNNNKKYREFKWTLVMAFISNWFSVPDSCLAQTWCKQIWKPDVMLQHVIGGFNVSIAILGIFKEWWFISILFRFN